MPPHAAPGRVAAPWPPGFVRLPDEEWTRAPVEALAAKYDAVEKHGWYANLDPTVEELAPLLADGRVLVDYSGGTGILVERLLRAAPGRGWGVVDVDSSPKFLALAVRKLASDERVAFRLLRWRKEERRLDWLDEALGPAMAARGVDAIVSANAIHLYVDLDATIASWARCLRPGGRVLVQSGNVRAPDAEAGAPSGRADDAWIIDDTVAAAAVEAERLARADPALAAHVARLEARRPEYDDLRRRYFLPPRPLGFYLDALRRAGLAVESVRHRRVQALAKEWHEFLVVYAEGILPWVGGAEKVDGRPASEADERVRRDLLRRSLDAVLGGAETFDARWTYVTCRKPA